MSWDDKSAVPLPKIDSAQFVAACTAEVVEVAVETSLV